MHKRMAAFDVKLAMQKNSMMNMIHEGVRDLRLLRACRSARLTPETKAGPAR
jgi:hypothetical protein